MSKAKFSWFVEYKGGKRFAAIAEDGTERSYDHIPDRDQIALFCLFDIETKKAIFTLHLDENQRLIYRRRVFKPVGNKDSVFYLVGWRMNQNGECIQSIAYVHEETGYVQMAGKFRENHSLFDSPILRDFEK